MSDRALNSSKNSCFSSFYSVSCSSTVRLRELRKGLIKLGIGLRISNARCTILARVSDFGHFKPFLAGYDPNVSVQNSQ